MSAKARTAGQLINSLVLLHQRVAEMHVSAIAQGPSDKPLHAQGKNSPQLPAAVTDQGTGGEGDDLMKLILTSLAESVRAAHGFFYQYDAASGILELRGGRGLYAAHVGYQVKESVGMADTVLSADRPTVVNDYQSWEGRCCDHRWDQIRALCALPLTFKGKLVGAMGLVHTEEGRIFGNADVALLTRFGALAAAVLANATKDVQARQVMSEHKQLREELQNRTNHLQETFFATVNALATAIEMKDPYIAAHQRWVTRLACAIADEMDLPGEQITGLRMAGLIHDIGKINVPTELLIKPGRLTAIEYEAIKIHPQSGYEIVKEIQFPWPIAQIVLQHHERMDGSGYPHGISNSEILPEARILAVADVVESMSSHRPYRNAHGIEIALGEISKNKDILYDRTAVEACVKVFQEKGFTFE
jgi:putative nucleotidyltransferase with HDIG domain